MEKPKCSYYNCTKNAKYEIDWTMPTADDKVLIYSHEFACDFIHTYLLALTGGIYECQGPIGTDYPVNRMHPDETPTHALVLSTGKRHEHLEKILETAFSEGSQIYQKVYNQNPFEVAKRGKMARY